MIAVDLDGTVTQYGSHDEPTRYNEELWNLMADYVFATAYLDQHVTIVTNQGGMAFGGFNAKYPSPEQVQARLRDAATWLSTRYVVDRILVSTYHPRALLNNIHDVSMELAEHMRFYPWRCDILEQAEFRKPRPHMLWLCGANVFFGDDDTDEQAAKDAHRPFVRVTRFV